MQVKEEVQATVLEFQNLEIRLQEVAVRRVALQQEKEEASKNFGWLVRNPRHLFRQRAGISHLIQLENLRHILGQIFSTITFNFFGSTV